MKSAISIRIVKLSDAAPMLSIYSPIVQETATSFELTPPPLEEFEQRILTYGTKAPWLVAEENGVVTGYAYATDHRSRKAYQWNQEVTVYVHPNHRNKGIARKLYLQLLHMLQAMNYCKAIAVITVPNQASIGFHQALGFRHIGEMKNVGYKLGRWHTTSWWDLDLHQSDASPQPLKSLQDILSQFGFQDWSIK
ncbi:GNAT family N-acetyltransferase [Roseivirga thermotolerans]|uniref:Hypothetical phosphinothricin N-acetyltransferase n=1 Tax=Roseivirga thermotolerans TaxID=1758176 RepID=A0ABQ3I840_9BACT|nr:GNAT family N-acetyltransferase [Roseivirga thermotolerans]GHE62922.1 hypothetical phosphinothricin N-acetyltransferase [Roseivirga thermotolerans]